MGDVVDQDRAYTTPIIHALLSMYQKEWEELGWAMPMQSMCSVMFLLVASLGGMMGYKVLWTNLGVLRYDLLYCEDLGDKSAVVWPIVGRFKARGGSSGLLYDTHFRDHKFRNTFLRVDQEACVETFPGGF